MNCERSTKRKRKGQHFGQIWLCAARMKYIRLQKSIQKYSGRSSWALSRKICSDRMSRRTTRRRCCHRVVRGNIMSSRIQKHTKTKPLPRLRQRVTADPGKPGRNIHDIQDKPEGAVSSRSPTTTIRHGFLPAGRQTTTNGPPGKSKRLAYSKTRLSTIAAVRVRGESISRYLAKKRITHVETKENVPLICEP